MEQEKEMQVNNVRIQVEGLFEITFNLFVSNIYITERIRVRGNSRAGFPRLGHDRHSRGY